MLASHLQFGMFAGTNGFVIPAIRGSVGSSFAGWENFKFGKETNNAPDLTDSTRDAGLAQTQANGFVTGSGNIYNISDPSVFKVSFASWFSIKQVVFQARTLGAELDYDSVRIWFDENGERKSLSTTRAEMDRGTAQGVNVSSKWEWDLSGRDATVFNIEFAAAGPSLSFDSATLDVATEVIRITNARVDLDRWMYPFNATPGVRPSASVFAAFGEDSGADTRDAQFLLGWNTGGLVPSSKGALNYIIRNATVSLTVNRDLVWAYDGTIDDWRTYLTEADDRHSSDLDAGRPVELFGAGFRGGFTAATFPEDGPFGGDGNGAGVRNVYAAGFDETGALIDVSNNVGKREADAFAVVPFAVGAAPGLANGDLVPTGTVLSFDINTADALISSYFSSALNDGRLRLIASSLVAGSFTGPNYAQFYTKENTLARPEDMPRISLDVQIAKNAPQLAVDGISGSLRFSWDTGFGRYELQSSNSLDSDSEWAAVAGAPTIEGNIASLEIGNLEGNRFYRLHRVL